MSMALLELKNVSKGYAQDGEPNSVLSNIDLSIARGEFVALVGYSGAGKSTLVSLIAGLLVPDKGSVRFEDAEVRGPGPERGVVFQSYSLLPWLSVHDNVTLAVDAVFTRESAAARLARVRRYVKMVSLEHAATYLRLVGLGDALNKKPSALSAGMRQRVGLARAFALSPQLLLLDEPFGMLDSLTRLELQDVLLELWRKEKLTALMVTHDVDEALFLSDRIVMMTKGPRARVGEILTVPFARPRERMRVLEEPRYYELRERIIGFLEQQEEHAEPAPRLEPAHAAAPAAASA
jgi:nitrate/nitrite transport system ATP-binding protein